MWDYDACAPVVLFDTVDEHGKTVPAAAEAGKVGSVFIVNRLTGKLIRKSPPIVTVNENFMKPLTTTPITIYPGQQGRRDVVAAGLSRPRPDISTPWA